MKQQNKLAKLVALVLTCCTLMVTPVMAQTPDAKSDTNPTSSSTNSSELVPYGVGYGSINFPSSKTLRINRGYVDTVSYTGFYGIGGNSGVLTLRFTNQSTGDFKSFSFICDNTYYVQKMNIQIPAGTYTVEAVGSNVKNFKEIHISFS